MCDFACKKDCPCVNHAFDTPCVMVTRTGADRVVEVWEEYVEGLGGTPDGHDYLSTLIESYAAKARNDALEEAAKVADDARENGDDLRQVRDRIRALKTNGGQ